MPAIAITAVNTGTETMTAVAHGLLTGDRFRVRAGAGGAVPTGLAVATDYWAIRVDADNIKPAASSADALANTPINLTAAGSSAFVEYGLPYCIPTAIASPMTQMKSANDNAAWAALVALYCFLVGLAQSVWTGITLAANQSITISGTARYRHGDVVKTFHAYAIQTANTITKTSGAASLGTNGGNYFLPLQGFDVGHRIKSVTVDLFGNGVDDIDVTFRKTNAGVETVIDTFTHSNQAAAWSQVTFNLTDTTIAAGDSFELQFSPNGTAMRVGSSGVTHDLP